MKIVGGKLAFVEAKGLLLLTYNEETYGMINV